MENQKEIYRVRAIAEKNKKQTLNALVMALIFCAVVFAVSIYLPFSWAFEIGAIVLSALYINKVMKQGTFVKTYILYEDSLSVVTRYGLIELETARYPLSETVFTESSITFDGKTVPFFPDEKLKSLILN